MKKTCFWLVVCLFLSVCMGFAEGADDVSAMIDQAQTAFEAEDFETAVPLLMEAAEKGDATAQNWLGTCYSAGTGVEQVVITNDNDEAYKMLINDRLVIIRDGVMYDVLGHEL